jgi:hypothetical protein
MGIEVALVEDAVVDTHSWVVICRSLLELVVDYMQREEHHGFAWHE